MEQKIIDYFERADPILFAILEKADFQHYQRKSDYFCNLCDQIISQQLSIKAGNTIFSSFKNLFPFSLPTSKFTLKLSDQAIRDAGISFKKISYLKDLAGKIETGELDLEKLNDLSDEEIIVKLTKVKGIGVWTAEMFLMSALGREDIFSYGDLGIRKAMQKLYKLDKEPTKDQALKISQSWSPYRTYACRILWKFKEKK